MPATVRTSCSTPCPARRRRPSGAIVIDGTPIGTRGITARRRLDAAFVPEERLGHGAVPRFKLSQNVVLTRHGTREGLVRTGVLNFVGARGIVGRITDLFDVRKGSPDPEAVSLSGGNLQKFVVGREFDRKPGVLVVCQPTWGVDAGAATTIRQALIDLARAGSAVLVISQDLDEILEISDRVAVISKAGCRAARRARHHARGDRAAHGRRTAGTTTRWQGGHHAP